VIASILETNNRDLFLEASQLLAIVERVQAIEELADYREWLVERIANIQASTQDALIVVSYGFPELIPELLSRTQQLRREFGIIRDRLLAPLTRASEQDRASLRILNWLHQTNPATESIPFALSDGGFASWPWPPHAALYFAPGANSTGLRFSPLLFHEFGHVLYAARTSDFDPVVGELQQSIDRILTPRSVRNDARAAAEAGNRANIVETWYEWAQEFFCDAVGLLIGGPAYLFAFSNYLQLLGAGDFPSSDGKDSRNTHPPTRLRIQVLLAQVTKFNLNGDLSKASILVEQQWEAIAQAVQFDNDYFGLYVPEMDGPLNAAIDQLISLSGIRHFATSDVEPPKGVNFANPIQLVNAAWVAFRRDPERYPAWEQDAIGSFLVGSGRGISR
jgi:hypothetical protein